jgi:chromosome segregation ATPase
MDYTKQAVLRNKVTSDLTDLHEFYIGQIAELQSLLETAKAGNAAKVQELQAARDSLNVYVAETSSLRGEIERKDREIAALHTQALRLKRERDTAVQRQTDIENAIDYKKEHAELLAERDSLKTENELARRACELKTQQIDSLTEANAVLGRNHKAVLESVAEKDSFIANMTHANMLNVGEYADLQAENEKLKADYAKAMNISMHVPDLTGQIAELQRQIHNYKLTIEEQRKLIELAEERSKLPMAFAQHMACIDKLRKCRARNKELEATIVEYRSKAIQLRAIAVDMK